MMRCILGFVQRSAYWRAMGTGQERGPSEDVERFGSHHLLDELQVAGHEGLFVVDHGVDLPDREEGAVGVGQREGVHQDVVELVEQGL